MKLEVSCIKCLKDKEIKRALTIEDSGKRAEYLQKVDAILEGDKQMSPPEYLAAFYRVFDGTYGTIPSYKELKVKYNRLMLENEEMICRRIQRAEDPLKAAIQAAQAGNYIDFIAMDGISEDRLQELLSDFETKKFDYDMYDKFRKDLRSAGSLIYITDNCGEIVADKLLIREIKKYAPQIDVTILTRGCDVGNDATVEDAEQVGLDREGYVIGNGTDIAGTCISLLPEKIRKRVLEADMIISKGQGNYETLSGCGENIYYLFLCKCELFMQSFHAEYLEPIFCSERNVDIAEKEKRTNEN